MQHFHYIAEDSQGVRCEGSVTADGAAEAQRQLEDEGLRVVELNAVSDDPKEVAPKLSDRESEQVVLAVAELSSAELPLAEGLRAAADESASKRVGRALRSIASDVEAGYALESIMTDRGNFLPPHVRGLVAAAARTGRLGLALDDLVEHHRATREVWGKVLGAITYPLIVLGATLAVLVFLPIFIVPQFKQMFEEFGLELPAATKAIIAVSDSLVWLASGPGIWVVFVLGSTMIILMILASIGVGTPLTHRFTTTMPLVGPIWQWCGAASFSRLLATLLDYGIPLPEALLLTRDGIRDPDVREIAALFARGVENGNSLSDLMLDSNRLPATIRPFVMWGERTGKLPEALHAVTDMLLTRVQMRTVLLQAISPPVVFIVVGLVIGFTIISLFMPLVTLITALS